MGQIEKGFRISEAIVLQPLHLPNYPNSLWIKGFIKIRLLPKTSKYPKIVFPDGIMWDKENDEPRTIRENAAKQILEG